MQTWVKRADSSTVCKAKGCEREWTPGEMVVVARTPQGNVSFHPECWLAQAQVWLEETGGGDPKPGRVKLDISDEVRARRISLLRKRAANEQRITRYLEKWKETGSRRHRLMVLRLLILQEQLRGEMADLGGVPEKWLPVGKRVKELGLGEVA